MRSWCHQIIRTCMLQWLSSVPEHLTSLTAPLITFELQQLLLLLKKPIMPDPWCNHSKHFLLHRNPSLKVACGSITDTQRIMILKQQGKTHRFSLCSPDGYEFCASVSLRAHDAGLFKLRFSHFLFHNTNQTKVSLFLLTNTAIVRVLRSCKCSFLTGGDKKSEDSEQQCRAAKLFCLHRIVFYAQVMIVKEEKTVLGNIWIR